MRTGFSSWTCFLATVLSSIGLRAGRLPAGSLPPDRLLADHPRIFFNAETWPVVKARAEGPARAARDALLARCDGYPDTPVCSGTEPVGRRTVKTADGRTVTTSLAHSSIPPIVEFGTQASECALAWRLTGERKYLDKCVAMLRESVRGYREAYRNGRAVNWYSTTRINALCAYDWIYNDIPDDVRREIIVPFVQHVEETVTKPGVIRRNDGNERGTTGFYGVESLLWYSGLAAFGDGYCDDLAKRHLAVGYELFRRVLDVRSQSAGDDGALLSATPGYAMGCYPWAHFNYFHSYLSAYGRNVAADYPAMAYYPNWVYWTWIQAPSPDRKPRFSGVGDDQHLTNDLPLWLMYEHLTQYMHFYREADTAAARLAAALRGRCPNRNFGGRDWPVYPFLMDAAAGAVEPWPDDLIENPPLKARHFQTLGQFVMRSGWKPESTYAFFFAGATLRTHKHYDENSFVIHKHDFLALDTGSRANQTDCNLRYYYAQTVAHNAMVIRREGERMPGYWGPEYDGPEGKVNHGGQFGAPATVLAFGTDAHLSYVASDATACYNDPKGPAKCDECVRQFVHVQPDIFVVYDRVSTREETDAKEWLLHFQNEPVVANGVVAAAAGEGRLFCQTLLPAKAHQAVVGGPGKEFWSSGRNWDFEERFKSNQLALAKKRGYGPYWGGWRLEVSSETPSKAVRFLNVLNVGDGKTRPVDAKLACKGDYDGVTLAVPDQVCRGQKGTLEVAVLFCRTGKVGGKVRYRFLAKDGTVVAKSERPLADAVQPQKGVIFGCCRKVGYGERRFPEE